ncbi:MAG: helix-turn-helix transcriptional regulator [Devosia nanyangense]|uniref:Helix-turn-helix transcriptional regulator n=1 Tax=Devosia nanyangense TaxID=1228055 RepID=A0A933KYM0_9HYPH|nr:helix-turn-helix transcriptional regulator [Devosia nanyangense]
MDRRALRTRRALHEALIQLIFERDYDGISVADIADAANVGRSTFYAHFTDKDDLLRSGIDHLRAILFAEHSSDIAGETQAERRPLGFSRFMTGHIQEQLGLYRAIMRGRAGPIILGQIRQFLSEIVRKELIASSGNKAAPEITVQFVVGAYMSVLTWWLDRGAVEPAEHIDAAFRSLAERALKDGR